MDAGPRPTFAEVRTTAGDQAGCETPAALPITQRRPDDPAQAERRARYGPAQTANHSDSRSLTDNETHHLTCVYAAHPIRTRSLPSWSCGFDSRRPLSSTAFRWPNSTVFSLSVADACPWRARSGPAEECQRPRSRPGRYSFQVRTPPDFRAADRLTGVQPPQLVIQRAAQRPAAGCVWCARD
jgi:hypothetical protein